MHLVPRLKPLLRMAKGDAALLTIVSLCIQITNFGLLFIAKTQLTDAQFTAFLTQISIAGILGSLGTLRLEVLVFQKFREVSFAAVLLPILSLAGILLTVYFISFLAVLVYSGPPVLSPWTSLLILGGALSTAQDFLFIQKKRVDLVLYSRVTQSVFVLLLCALLAFDWVDLSGEALAGYQGIAMLSAVIIWLGGFLAVYRKELLKLPIFFFPDRALLFRGASLGSAAMTNSVYTNLPLLASAATQSVGFTADFGFLLRLFTAPITLIKSVLGKMFLRQSLNWDASEHGAIDILRKMIRRTMFVSLGVFAMAVVVILTTLWAVQDLDVVSRYDFLPFLILGTLMQSMVNPVTQVRIALKDERSFAAFDIFRVIALFFGLFVLGSVVRYDIVYGVVTFLLYSSTVVFIQSRVRALKA